eukprot:CAMPEP_0194347144 /NCGR_PEP_ID=MMETSP0171-20130528/105825_1 /TAXON_ID=218684 /ORGANISM="Corethron pennatum, Strain L29A3" /LENGTH=498 /DNA_ID=CAMNT_0039114365 /DNA_START=285 /DNA_END=1784 /DNA_ORIENTATION=-
MSVRPGRIPAPAMLRRVQAQPFLQAASLDTAKKGHKQQQTSVVSPGPLRVHGGDVDWPGFERDRTKLRNLGVLPPRRRNGGLTNSEIKYGVAADSDADPCPGKYIRKSRGEVLHNFARIDFLSVTFSIQFYALCFRVAVRRQYLPGEHRLSQSHFFNIVVEPPLFSRSERYPNDFRRVLARVDSRSRNVETSQSASLSLRCVPRHSQQRATSSSRRASSPLVPSAPATSTAATSSGLDLSEIAPSFEISVYFRCAAAMAGAVGSVSVQHRHHPIRREHCADAKYRCDRSVRGPRLVPQHEVEEVWQRVTHGNGAEQPHGVEHAGAVPVRDGTFAPVKHKIYHPVGVKVERPDHLATAVASTSPCSFRQGGKERRHPGISLLLFTTQLEVGSGAKHDRILFLETLVPSENGGGVPPVGFGGARWSGIGQKLGVGAQGHQKDAEAHPWHDRLIPQEVQKKIRRVVAGRGALGRFGFVPNRCDVVVLLIQFGGSDSGGAAD